MCCLSSPAAERADSLSVRVYFPQNESSLDLGYRANHIFLGDFISGVRAIMSDPSCMIQEIGIRSGASPEGDFYLNMELGLRRACELEDYLRQSLPLPPGCRFNIEAVGEDWVTLHERIIRGNIPDREKVLEILDRHSGYVLGSPASPEGSPKEELMKLNGGRTWKWLLENIFPDLRSAGNAVICRYVRQEEPATAPTPTPAPSVNVEEPRAGASGRIIDTVVVIHKYLPDYGLYDGGENHTARRRTAGRARRDSIYRFAFRTNLLFDAVLAPNIEVEFPIGRRVSILASHTFPWYTLKEDRYAYELLNTGAELRLWLGDRRRRSVLTGGYLGLYGAAARADLEYDSKGFQVPFTWHAGITAGWSFPLGKRDNWRLDLGVGIGCMPYSYDSYERSDFSGLLIYKRSGEGLWIGPTNVRCAIVWMLPMKHEK